MRHMMATVPRIHLEDFTQYLTAIFRMIIAPLPLLLGERFEQCDPPVMQWLQQMQRNFDWKRVRIMKLSPELFIVSWYQRPVFSQCTLCTHVGIDVAVGNVMNQLADRPAAFAVWCVDLSTGESMHGRTQIFRQGSQHGNGGPALLWGLVNRTSKFSNGITRIFAHRPAPRLPGPVMVVVMTMMAVMRLRKRRGREQQRQGQNNQLLHAAIVART